MSKIEDFGEYLDGAAKDRARNFIGRMRHVADVEVANATLARSFPEPDYKGLIEDGADPFGVAFVRSLRESIPPKPRNRGLEMWARVVRDFRNLSERVIRGDLREEEIRATGAGPTASSGLRKAIDKADLYLIAGHDTSLKKLEFGFKRYRIDGQVAQYRENWEVAPVRRKSDRLTPRPLVKSPDRDEALKLFRSLVAKGGLENLNATKKKEEFAIYSYRNKPGTKWIGKKVGKNYIDLESFPSTNEAVAYRREHVAELREKLARLKDLPAYRGETNRTRVGPDYREGKDVSPEDFMKAFSFRGVQFGNYVEKGRRQQDLNDSYDALMDLAFVLDMDSTAISLNGRLGLAFGARGRGGVNPASAHFEPMECVINLTKANGAGSLAHEWLHGVDNHLSHMTGRSSGMISAFLPARAGQVMRAHIFGEDALPDPIVAGLNEVNDAINRTGIAARCRQLDQTRSSPYYQLREEILARTFECYVIGRLEEKGIQNDYLANISPEAVYEATAALTGQPAGRYPYLKEDERESVFKAYDVLMRESGIAAHLMPEEARVNADPAHRTPAQIFDEVEFDQDQLEPEDRQSALYRPAGGGYDEVTSDQAAEAAPEKAEDDPGEEISWM